MADGLVLCTRLRVAKRVTSICLANNDGVSLEEGELGANTLK